MIKAIPELEVVIFRKALHELNRFEPELVLSTIWDIPPDVVSNFKKGPARTPITAVWCPDAMINFDRQYIFTAPWDYLFFTDEYIVEFFHNLELNAHLLPLACYPGWHRQVRLTPEEKEFYGCDITTAGNLYGVRVKVFEQLLDYDVKIWGASPGRTITSPVRRFHQHRYVGELEKSKAFNAAAIVLNNMHYAAIRGLNKRAFEACGCGGFQLISDSSVLAQYFVPGQEVVVYRNLQELRELVPYYLNRPEERAAIAAAGYRRAQSEHTYHRRLETMLRIIAADKNQSKSCQDDSIPQPGAAQPITDQEMAT
ncbi:CgeB family protein [Desulfobacca acetoxidans]|uniref:CgeB family protein n=1 Tax=Desulfobacca acetoxidans TaxID=60893 RepID=UPI00145D9634|nr:glycosyltransferase [Desulfobacca acetoxidans]